MWTACASSTEVCFFLLGSKTTFILNLDESIKSLHCLGYVEAEIACNIRLSLSKKNYTFTPCSRRCHCWSNDPSSWALVFGRSKSRIGCFDSVWMIKCGSVVLEDEKSWSSFVLVPVSGEASFVSSSESRVHFSDCSGTGRYIFYYKCSFWL